MGSKRAAWSVVLGLLSTLLLPAAIFATRFSATYELIHAGFVIPVAVAAGVAAVVLARRARALDAATLGREESGKTAATGRILGIVGICIAASATIALAVYGVLLAAD